MGEISPIATQIPTEIRMGNEKSSISTGGNFREFQNELRKRNLDTNATFEFLNDFGEKVKLGDEYTYQLFLSSSNGIVNYLITGALPPRPRVAEWFCLNCNFAKNPAIAEVCTKCKWKRLD